MNKSQQQFSDDLHYKFCIKSIKFYNNKISATNCIIILHIIIIPDVKYVSSSLDMQLESIGVKSLPEHDNTIM